MPEFKFRERLAYYVVRRDTDAHYVVIKTPELSEKEAREKAESMHRERCWAWQHFREAVLPVGKWVGDIVTQDEFSLYQDATYDTVSGMADFFSVFSDDEPECDVVLAVQRYAKQLADHHEFVSYDTVVGHIYAQFDKLYPAWRQSNSCQELATTMFKYEETAK